jgi:hypothetical protein
MSRANPSEPEHFMKNRKNPRSEQFTNLLLETDFQKAIHNADRVNSG